MRHCILLLVLGVAWASAHTNEQQTATGSPVGKVVTLLERLKKEIMKEGTEEAADYDKFACFCKEQADDKLYAITKSKEKITMLEAQIKELAAQIEELDAAIEKDKKEKKAKEAEGKEKAEERKAAREKYEEKEEEKTKVMAAIKEAIAALKESKEKMTDAKLSMVAHTALKVLATTTTTTSSSTSTTSTTAIKQAHANLTSSNATKQVNFVTSAMKALHAEEEKDRELMNAKRQIAELKAQLAKSQEKKYNASETEASSAVKKVFALLSGEISTDEPGKPPKYEYKSNSIIETLQTLFAQFRDSKYELDNAEMKEKQEYEMEKGARDMQIKFLGDLIEKNTKLSAEKAEKKASHETDRDDEKDLMDKDQKFMDELTDTCEKKAEGWDKRSEKRAAEITAITKAIEALNSGAVQNYGTTLLITKNKAGSNSDPGFLQLRSTIKRHYGHKKHGARKALSTFLTSQASMLKSKSLALVVAQIRFTGDNFAKIRELIKDLIQKIKDQMEAEKEKKKFCDEELGKAVDRRDEMLAATEEEANNIDGAKAAIAKLGDDLTEAEQQIAELYKSQNEATELRNGEKADNAKTLEQAKEGLAAVTQAIEVLKEFYGEFLQTKKAPGGRDGKSVEDLAPEAETGEYEGKKDQGTGIIGLLEVIQGDFERTIKDTEEAEDESKSEFEDQDKATGEDIDAMKQESKDKKDELETEESNLVDAKEALKEAKQRLADSKEELAKLRPQCVDLGLTFKARQARSEEEIKALEEALKILEEYAK